MEWITAFDTGAVLWINRLVGKSALLDWLIDRGPTPSVTLLPLVAALWWLWFSRTRPHARQAVVYALAGAVVALVVSRIVQDFMPYRPRPIHAGIPFTLPLGSAPDVVKEWSSFPSDHAAMAFALAAGLWMVSWRLGAAAAAWSAVVVCFPRLYTGVHYPTDLIAGAALGAACTWLLSLARFGGRAVALAESLERRHQPAFYTASLVVAFQMATMLADIRGPLLSFLRTVHH